MKLLDTYYKCPRCQCIVCQLPLLCPICNLMLADYTSFTRSYHHLDPLVNFTKYEMKTHSLFVVRLGNDGIDVVMDVIQSSMREMCVCSVLLVITCFVRHVMISFTKVSITVQVVCTNVFVSNMIASAHSYEQIRL